LSFIIASSRNRLLPDPKLDGIIALFYTFQEEDQRYWNNCKKDRQDFFSGVILVSETGIKPFGNIKMDFARNEKHLFQIFYDLFMARDPDILIGYEIHNSSWGYLIERSFYKYKIDLQGFFGRTMIDSFVQDFGDHSPRKKYSNWEYKKASALKIVGRIILNLWRLCRSELTNLISFSVESVAFYVLKRRLPFFDNQTLLNWFENGCFWRVIEYYSERTKLNLILLEELNLVGRFSEFSKIYGIDFYSVISRGSQYKVESTVIRIAKVRSFVMPSPTKEEVANMRAAECNKSQLLI
jgi:DNA polymerase zeta